MAPEALATLFGLAAAVYALLPAERRLDLRLRLHAVDWVVLWTAILLVHYILFFPIFRAIGMAPHLGPWRWGFTAETASYLVLLAATLFVATRASRATLTRSKIPRFRELLEKLLYQHRYADLIILLDRHLPTLGRAYKNDYWLPRLRDRLDPSNLVILTQPERKPSPVVQRLARLLPQYGGAPRDAAKDVVRRLLLADDFVRELAKIQPHLGLRILEQELEECGDFQSLWLTALLEDTTSVLYHEITNAVTSGGLDDGGRILHLYLDDVQRARNLVLPKPLLGYVVAQLDRRQSSPATDRYNQPLDDFPGEPLIKDAVWAALCLYELMVSAAIRQGVQWPIPLYHFTNFTDRITRNLSPDAGVDLTKEWPTPYHFFLDRMVSWLCEWIESATDQSEGDANAAPRLDDLRYGNGDIPKNSVLALGQVSKTIMIAATVDDPFKVRVLEAILELEGDRYGGAPLHPFGDLVLESMVSGGDNYQTDSDNVAALARVTEQVDPALKAADAFKRLERILDTHRNSPGL